MNAQTALDHESIQYTTPLAAALHTLCVDRLQRRLRSKQDAPVSGDRGATLEKLSELARDLDTRVEQMDTMLTENGVSAFVDFASPPPPLRLLSTGESVRQMLDVLVRFDSLAVRAYSAYVQCLLPEAAMDELFDSYVEQILAHSTGR